jgi:hypothetical protein
MNSIDKRDLEDLKKKHKDVFENPAVDSLIQLKIRGDAGILEYNPDNYPVMSETDYSIRSKKSLAYFQNIQSL